MNVFSIRYEKIEQDFKPFFSDKYVITIGDANSDSCEFCVDFRDQSTIIENVIKRINTADADSEISIISMLGKNEKFSEVSDLKFVRDYIDFFCLIFGRLVTLDRKINFMQVGNLDSSIVPLFEGIAFSACHESGKIKAKSLKIDTEKHTKDLLSLCFSQKEDRFLIRDNELYARRAFPEDLNDTNCSIKDRGVYVITGGNGGIGHLLDNWLVQKHHARVIVLGRSELTAEQVEKIKSLKVSSYISVDVADYDALEKAFVHIADYYGHIDGVFHLAGSIKDKLLRNHESKNIDAVVKPKIYGAVNLFKISQKMNLRQVCFFSSLSGIVGNIGQAVYSAANAFMDDFCRYLHEHENCKTWCSINWGAWDSEGMQMKTESSDIEQMQSPECFEILEQLLSKQHSQFAVWKGNRNFLSPQSFDNCNNNLKDVDTSCEASIRNLVYNCVKKFSGFSNIDFDQSIIDLGIDSVGLINIAVSIENIIKKHIPQYKLSKTLLFEHFTVNKITVFLIQTLPKNVIREIAFNFSGIKEEEKILVVKHNDLRNTALIKTVESEQQEESDIAIVGMAGEFPGAQNIPELNKLLSSGLCAIKPVPKNRWDWKKYYSPDKNESNRSYCRHGGFIEDAANFDSMFFGITSSEAIKIDPQERRFLQISYHALEDSGYFANPHKQVGIFVAAMFNHYQNLCDDSQPFISGSFASIANRVSFYLDFKGPSVCVDSMCSGSLTALNLAVTAIKSDECSVAIVGGVNFMPHPGKYIALSREGFLSPNGRCQSFGTDADGYVPGEGTVAIVIKKMRDALKNGDRIYGIIKGISINSAGRSSGYSVPSAVSQSAVIKRALSKANVNPIEITYIETHGTGTALGDPIEIEGLKTAYENSIDATGEVCWLGAIKSNIGHLESAAGLAGLVKILLQFKNRKIYPSLFSQIENSELALDNSRFKLAKSVVDWDTNKYAGLSSFGAGGSNAHVILQNFENKFPNEMLDSYIIPISAKTEEALRTRISDLLHYVENEEYDLYSLSYTLCCTREHFDKRVCYVVANKDELIHSLKFRESVDDTKVKSLVEKYLNAENIDFNSLFKKKKIQTLPFYPFEKNHYWLDFCKSSITDSKTKADTEFILLKPYYTKNTNIVLHNDITTVYINALHYDSNAYFITDKKTL
jgi:3-oxoacyl-(acyl-carrier-protein) synthase/NADP-dependent 3-hydroxy acid dehydrogenase YdfG/acyl carrier protein